MVNVYKVKNVNVGPGGGWSKKAKSLPTYIVCEAVNSILARHLRRFLSSRITFRLCHVLLFTIKFGATLYRNIRSNFQGRHGEFEPGKALYSTPNFFDRLFLIRAY